MLRGFSSSRPALRSRATLYSARGVHGWCALCVCAFDRARAGLLIRARLCDRLPRRGRHPVVYAHRIAARPLVRCPVAVECVPPRFLCLFASGECVCEILDLCGLGGRAASRALCAIKRCVFARCESSAVVDYVASRSLLASLGDGCRARWRNRICQVCRVIISLSRGARGMMR